ncbi:hypothetical protein D3C75_848070 [compost metagenome]
MMDIEDKVASLLGKIIEVSELLLGLDLEDEEQVNKISELQKLKEELQTEIDLITGRDYKITVQINELLKYCLSLEKNIHTKFVTQRDSYRNHLAKIHEAKKTRQIYNTAYSQVDGFFY